jgi:hypothetical protein
MGRFGPYLKRAWEYTRLWVLLGGGRGGGAFRKFPIAQRKKCLVVPHVYWTIIVKGIHLTINEHK